MGDFDFDIGDFGGGNYMPADTFDNAGAAQFDEFGNPIGGEDQAFQGNNEAQQFQQAMQQPRGKGAAGGQQAMNAMKQIADAAAKQQSAHAQGSSGGHGEMLQGALPPSPRPPDQPAIAPAHFQQASVMPSPANVSASPLPSWMNPQDIVAALQQKQPNRSPLGAHPGFSAGLVDGNV